MFISDDKIIFNLQGLRWIAAGERVSYTSNKIQYDLELQYKGSTKTVIYKDKSKRDEIYKLAVEKLTAIRRHNQPVEQTGEKLGFDIYPANVPGKEHSTT